MSDTRFHGESLNNILRDVKRNLSILFYQIGYLDEAVVWHTEGWKCGGDGTQVKNGTADDCVTGKLERMVCRILGCIIHPP